METLTDQIEERAWDYLEKIDAMGGAVNAIESGYMQDEIEQAAYAYAKAVDSGSKIIVGVNEFIDEAPESPEVFPIDPALQAQQVARVRALKLERDGTAVAEALADLATGAREGSNLLYPMKEALRRRATLGEVSDTLRTVFGTYQPRG